MASRDRAAAVRDAFITKAPGYVAVRGIQRLVFDQLPVDIFNKAGEIIGVGVMVRLFNGLTEVPIDPHRVIINPPLTPRANLTYDEGALDASGLFLSSGRIVVQKAATEGVAYRRIIGVPNPEAALLEALWDSVDRVPNVPGWRTRGTVSTVYATAPGGSGSGEGTDPTYLTARSTFVNPVNSHFVGQTTGYSCFESALIFDTSGIPDADDVSAVVLSLDGSSDSSTQDFTVIAASSAYDGGAYVAADWIAGASLDGQTTYANWPSSGYSAGYNTFVSVGAAFNSAINKTGNTALMLYSDRHLAATVPTGGEYVIFTDADNVGTTADAKLDITHAGAFAPGLSIAILRKRRR